MYWSSYKIWNAEVSSNEGNEYVIKNVGWNQDIVAGNSIEFGLSGDHAFKGFPENCELIGTHRLKKQIKEILNEKKNNHRYDNSLNYCINHNWNAAL